MDKRTGKLALKASKCGVVLGELREFLETRNECKDISSLTYMYKVGQQRNYSNKEVFESVFDGDWWKYKTCKGSSAAQHFFALVEKLEPLLWALHSDTLYNLFHDAILHYLHSIPCSDQSYLASEIRKHLPIVLNEDSSEPSESYCRLVGAILSEN